jgi:hypothetical protein
MPESPDFDTIARRLLDSIWATDVRKRARHRRPAYFHGTSSHLNARGAVDIAKVESELSTMMGWTAAGPYVKNLDRALRGLDR